MTVYEVDALLSDSALHLFASTCTFDAVQAAEGEGWAPTVWEAVAEAGFAWIGLPEDAGGSGGTLLEAAEVLRIAGAHAAPIPLAETALLGGWLLTEAGLALPDGPITMAPGLTDDTVSARSSGRGSVVLDGTVHRVPWAARAERIVALVELDDQPAVVTVDPAQTRIEAVPNLAGEPRDTVHLDGVTLADDRVARLDDPTVADQLRLRGALSRTVMMAGALEAMSRLTVDYTEQRQQFGRPVARFQAVQQHLVWGAQDAAIATMAARVAAGVASAAVEHGSGRRLTEARFQIASARTIADEAATAATRWAHQAHGAMGMTQEYPLHHLSRRLWAWRHEYAAPGEWPGAVGRLAEAAGADGLYPLIAS